MVPPEVIHNHRLCKLFVCVLEIIMKKIKINNLLFGSQINELLLEMMTKRKETLALLCMWENIEYLVWKRREYSL